MGNRVKYSKQDNELVIVISNLHWTSLLLLPLLSIIIYFMVNTLYRQQYYMGNFFETLFTIFSLIFSFYCIWVIFGKETITVTPGSLKIKRSIYNIGKINIFELAKLTNLRNHTYVLPTKKQEILDILNVYEGKIKFDYKGKTYSFGILLKEAESKDIIKRIKSFKS